MTQTPFQKPERYIRCPACGKSEHQVSHLAPGTQTSWYCDDCGVRFDVRVISPESVDCEVRPGESKEKRLVTLRSSGPVTLLVEGMVLLPADADDEESSQRYFYDDHTCPTNYLPSVVKVIDAEGDEDPHGVFAFVSIEPWKPEYEEW